MNDLDRDLRELFHDKAGSIDAAPAAPTDVLRRGRRRQVRTVFASSLAAVAALAIAVAVAARLTGGPNQIPVTNPPTASASPPSTASPSRHPRDGH